jgi:hypothetical protein
MPVLIVGHGSPLSAIQDNDAVAGTVRFPIEGFDGAFSMRSILWE